MKRVVCVFGSVLMLLSLTLFAAETPSGLDKIQAAPLKEATTLDEIQGTSPQTHELGQQKANLASSSAGASVDTVKSISPPVPSPEQSIQQNTQTGDALDNDLDMNVVDIIRAARVKAIEYSDNASTAKTEGNAKLAAAYLKCSTAMNKIARGYEQKSNPIIKQGRLEFKRAYAEMCNSESRNGQYRMCRNPQYTLETAKED